MTAFPLPPAVDSDVADSSDAIERLRQLARHGAMSWTEVHSIAERQAALLLDLWRIEGPPVPQFVIASVPGVLVDYRRDWPTSGMSVQARSHWQIVIRADEPRWRQRFSLAHEFKHILDDPICERMSMHLPKEQRQERAEALCNFFAACLLMPRPWVKHDWCGGIQNVRELARRYYVSEEAMTTRLSELGLTHMTLALEKRVRHSGVT